MSVTSPHFSQQTSTPASPSYATLDVAAQVELLTQRLSEFFWSQLKMPASASALTGHQAIVKSYNDSLQTLQAFRSELNLLLKQLSQDRISVNEEAATHRDQLRQFAAREIANIYAAAEIPQVAVSTHLHAELFGDEVENVLSYLLSDLQQAAGNLARDFVAALEKFTEQSIIGQISWPVKTACRFRYFDLQVSEKSVNTQVETTQEDYSATTTTTTRGKVDFDLLIRRQQLAAAERYPLPKYASLIPARVRSLLDVIPTWLRPEIEIVEGDLFRSDEGKKRLKTEHWSETQVQTVRWEDTDLDYDDTFLDYHEDPAATLGPYVLSAWLCEERDEELHELAVTKHQRQQAVVSQRQAAQVGAWQTLGLVAGLQLIPFLLHLLGLGLGKPLHFVAFVASLVLLYPLRMVLDQIQFAFGIKNDASLHMVGVAGVVCGVLAWQAAFLAVAYSLLPAACGCLLLSAATVYFSQQFLAHQP